MTITMHVDNITDVEHVDTTGLETTQLETIGNEMGNDILAGIARGEKVGRVSSVRRGMSGEMRGWTLGGRVD